MSLILFGLAECFANRIGIVVIISEFSTISIGVENSLEVTAMSRFNPSLFNSLSTNELPIPVVLIKTCLS